MDDRYDVIVVGAGNAGLSAAAATSKGGLKTLLLERNILPGGCATSFCRGRFEFEASLHELANVGNKEQNGVSAGCLTVSALMWGGVRSKPRFAYSRTGMAGMTPRCRPAWKPFAMKWNGKSRDAGIAS